MKIIADFHIHSRYSRAVAWLVGAALIGGIGLYLLSVI